MLTVATLFREEERRKEVGEGEKQKRKEVEGIETKLQYILA